MSARLAPAALALALVTGACRPASDALLICHNSNCVEPPDPEQDDTLATLQESLALRAADGSALIDGVEIDLFWRGEDEACLFAHDLNGDTERAPALDAADALAAYVVTDPATRAGGPFVLFVELKGHVAAAKDQVHTPAQRAQHAACAADVVDRVATAAILQSVPLRVIVTSFVPELLVAAAAQPAIGGRTDTGPVAVQLGALQGIPPPLDSQTVPLGRFLASGVPLDVLSAHPHWLRDGASEAAASADLDLALWMFSAVPETLAAIDRWQPTYVVTSEARALDAWLQGVR